MGVTQTTTWTCEVCGRYVLQHEEVFPYSDPTVTPPKGEDWTYTGEWPHELLTCPQCQVKNGR